MIHPTPNEANSGPRVGQVILSEIMYHPIGPAGTLRESFPMPSWDSTLDMMADT